MKFFLYSKSLDGAGIALRLKEEGNDVKVYVKNHHFRDGLKGLVDHVENPSVALAWRPDCILFDMVGSGSLADTWKRQGYNVVGASRFHDQIEFDRGFAMDWAKRAGIRVPKFFPFKKVKDAIAFIEKNEKRYVLKPDDNAGSTALTYVSRGTEDMVRFLQHAEESRSLKSFILQEFVKGIELSSEVWFSNGSPVYPTNGTMELKKFMAGNVGPNTGCMSSVVWPYIPKEPRIIQQTVRKCYPALKSIKFSGCLDVNTIVDEKGEAWFLEFTARFGYSAIYALCEILEEDLGGILYRCSKGELKEMKVRKEFGLSLRLSIPPFPLCGIGGINTDPIFKKTANHIIAGFPKGHTYLLDAKKEDGELKTSGADGVIAEVTWSGKDLKAATKVLYEKVKDIQIPDVQYRNDMSDRVLEELPKLKSLAYEVPDVATFS